MLNPTPVKIRLWIEQTGMQRKPLARLLGFRSDNSLRQCEDGRATLPADKAAWLADYAALCVRLDAEKARWLEQYPPPDASGQE
jgi:hypothetical protein